jgi:FK506-binding nuclear protein
VSEGDQKKASKAEKKKLKKLKGEEGQPVPASGDDKADSEDKKGKKDKKKDKKDKDPKEAAKPSDKKKDKNDAKEKEVAGGMKIKDLEVGTGPMAKKGNTVVMRYVGKLQNGDVFDKNTEGKPVGCHPLPNRSY